MKIHSKFRQWGIGRIGGISLPVAVSLSHSSGRLGEAQRQGLAILFAEEGPLRRIGQNGHVVEMFPKVGDKAVARCEALS